MVKVSWDVVFLCHLLVWFSRRPSDNASSRDTESLILDTIKSAVRFQKNVGDAWIKVCSIL